MASRLMRRRRVLVRDLLARGVEELQILPLFLAGVAGFVVADIAQTSLFRGLLRIGDRVEVGDLFSSREQRQRQ